jgi:hypothetical protein
MISQRFQRSSAFSALLIGFAHNNRPQLDEMMTLQSTHPEKAHKLKTRNWSLALPITRAHPLESMANRPLPVRVVAKG